MPEQVAASYIQAWNDRDAQAVSGLTCLWVGAFTPAGVVESDFALGPAHGPFVADYQFSGTDEVTVGGRELSAVHVQYVREGEGRTHEGIVYVREDDDHDPCVAVFTTW